MLNNSKARDFRYIDVKIKSNPLLTSADLAVFFGYKSTSNISRNLDSALEEFTSYYSCNIIQRKPLRILVEGKKIQKKISEERANEKKLSLSAALDLYCHSCYVWESKEAFKKFILSKCEESASTYTLDKLIRQNFGKTFFPKSASEPEWGYLGVLCKAPVGFLDYNTGELRFMSPADYEKKLEIAIEAYSHNSEEIGERIKRKLESSGDRVNIGDVSKLIAEELIDSRRADDAEFKRLVAKIMGGEIVMASVFVPYVELLDFLDEIGMSEDRKEGMRKALYEARGIQLISEKEKAKWGDRG